MFFLAKQAETGEKNAGQRFPNESEATCKNSADLEEKKLPKTSLNIIYILILFNSPLTVYC